MPDKITRQQVYAELDRCVEDGDVENFDHSNSSIYEVDAHRVAVGLSCDADFYDDIAMLTGLVSDWQRERKLR